MTQDPPDSSFVPGRETKDALIAAALDHANAAACTAFIVPIPNTTPPLFVALGERAQLLDLLATMPDA